MHTENRYYMLAQFLSLIHADCEESFNLIITLKTIMKVWQSVSRIMNFLSSLALISYIIKMHLVSWVFISRWEKGIKRKKKCMKVLQQSCCHTLYYNAKYFKQLLGVILFSLLSMFCPNTPDLQTIIKPPVFDHFILFPWCTLLIHL